MATRSSIEMDLKRAIEQANQIESIASRMSTLANSKFDNTLQNLSWNWKGYSASRYLNKGNLLKGNINRTVSDLRAIAREIRAEARRIYNADLAALEIAQRNY